MTTPTRLYPEYQLRVSQPDGSGVVDLTRRMVGFQFQYGSRFANSIGHVATPASGLITLDNRDGQLSPLGNPILDSRPGLLVDLDAVILLRGIPTSIPLFKAWSKGTSESHIVGARELVELPLEGALSFISSRFSRTFVLTNEDLLPGQIINLVLDDAGFPSQPRRIASGDVQLHQGRAQELTGGFSLRQLATLQGAQPVNTISVLNSLVLADGGYLWDDWQRGVVFQDYRSRHNPPLFTIAYNNSDVHSRTVYPTGESIVNSVAANENDAQLDDRGSIVQYLDANIPGEIDTGNEQREITIQLRGDSNVAYIHAVEDLVQGTHFRLESRQGVGWREDLTQIGNIAVRNDGDAVSFLTPVKHVQSPFVDTRIVILDITGRVARSRELLGRNIIRQVERASSRLRYGLHHINYISGELFVSGTDLQRRLENILDELDGITRTPLKRLDIRGQATFLPEDIPAETRSHKLLTTRTGQDITVSQIGNIDRPTPFHVDGVRHEWQVGRRHEVTLELIEAVYTA